MSKFCPTSPVANQIQTGLLILISAAIVLAAPQVWNFRPDSGIYIGSALSLLENGRYWFNGHPNLLYYPGTSTLLTIPIALFGMDFHAMHALFALLAVLTLWLSRACFPAEHYGWTGLLLPLLLGANQLFQTHAQLILSDIVFLDLVLLATYLWREFDNTGARRWFVACALVVALSPMFRFQGLFLIGAFELSALAYVYRRREAGWKFAFSHIGIAALVLLPFLLWTLRNYLLHTADTYNMANRIFFGLSGLPISGQGFGTVDWIDAEWKYPVYQIMYLFGGFGKTFLGGLGDHLPLELTTGAILGLIVMGSWAWLKRASLFEAVFVLSAGALLVQQATDDKSLYIVIRYWLPLLPFFIVIAGLGVQQLAGLSADSRYRKTIATGAGALTLSLLALGALGWADRLSGKNTGRMESAYDVTIAVTDYVRNHLPPEAVLLTTDWGVTPLLVERRSYKYLRSGCHKDTLEMILDKKADYLLITPGFRETRMGVDMAETFPQAFQPIFISGNRDEGSYGALFTIDRERVESLVANTRCAWKD